MLLIVAWRFENRSLTLVLVSTRTVRKLFKDAWLDPNSVRCRRWSRAGYPCFSKDSGHSKRGDFLQFQIEHNIYARALSLRLPPYGGFANPWAHVFTAFWEPGVRQSKTWNLTSDEMESGVHHVIFCSNGHIYFKRAPLSDFSYIGVNVRSSRESSNLYFFTDFICKYDKSSGYSSNGCGSSYFFLNVSNEESILCKVT